VYYIHPIPDKYAQSVKELRLFYPTPPKSRAHPPSLIKAFALARKLAGTLLDFASVDVQFGGY
jgi:hypothetical protein